LVTHIAETVFQGNLAAMCNAETAFVHAIDKGYELIGKGCISAYCKKPPRIMNITVTIELRCFPAVRKAVIETATNCYPSDE